MDKHGYPAAATTSVAPAWPMAGIQDGALCNFESDFKGDSFKAEVDEHGRIRQVGKHVQGHVEAVGIYRYSAEMVSQYVSEYREADAASRSSDVINRLLLRGSAPPYHAVSTGRLFAMDIDTPKDLVEAQLRLVTCPEDSISLGRSPRFASTSLAPRPETSSPNLSPLGLRLPP